MSESNSVSLMSWNIRGGGFDSYSPTQAMPDREESLRDFINTQHLDSGIDTVSLSDAYRWNEVYGSNEAIAKHLGYASARFACLNDARLEAKHGPGMGIAFATDKTIEQSTLLDLDTRQGLGVILDVGHHGLQIANVYLDHLDEYVRLRQIQALMAGLEKDLPTLIVGDFNALRPSSRGARTDVQLKDTSIRLMASLLPRRIEIGETIKGMNKRLTILLIESYEFTDADKKKKRPTAPARLPVFGIDYAFHNNGVNVKDFRVLPTSGQSDHRPISLQATVA
jgi:endonuclease/exonuclease/phosphatase family metal-dependent hydrolase